MTGQNHGGCGVLRPAGVVPGVGAGVPYQDGGGGERVEVGVAAGAAAQESWRWSGWSSGRRAGGVVSLMAAVHPADLAGVEDPAVPALRIPVLRIRSQVAAGHRHSLG